VCYFLRLIPSSLCRCMQVLRAFAQQDLFVPVAPLLLDAASRSPCAPKSNYEASDAAAPKEDAEEAGAPPPLAPALVRTPPHAVD
jgi:hypothetical protein